MEKGTATSCATEARQGPQETRKRCPLSPKRRGTNFSAFSCFESLPVSVTTLKIQGKTLFNCRFNYTPLDTTGQERSEWLSAEVMDTR